MLNAEGVAMVNGTPAAFAARARISSAPARPALMPPVGAIARGSAHGFPSSWISVSTLDTSTSTFGRMRTRSNAARFSRRVVSSSAPPSKKSKMARGTRRRARTRRSSMFTALVRSIVLLEGRHHNDQLALRPRGPYPVRYGTQEDPDLRAHPHDGGVRRGLGAHRQRGDRRRAGAGRAAGQHGGLLLSREALGKARGCCIIWGSISNPRKAPPLLRLLASAVAL